MPHTSHLGSLLIPHLYLNHASSNPLSKANQFAEKNIVAPSYYDSKTFDYQAVLCLANLFVLSFSTQLDVVGSIHTELDPFNVAFR